MLTASQFTSEVLRLRRYRTSAKFKTLRESVLVLDEIRSVIERWTSKNTSKSRSEAIVKQSLIVPILRRLGWDDESDDEVVTEYNVGGGEVDYALSHNRTAKVFIEAKREDEPLEKHEEQLLNYAFKQGVVMAVLTNGTTWWFYLSMREDPWRERKFTVGQIDKPELPNRLIYILSKDNVTSGDAIGNAEDLLRSQRILDCFPKAWETMKPDIVHLLTEKTQELCGYRPNVTEVEQFLSWIDNQAPTEAGVPEPKAVTPSDVSEPGGVKGTNDQSFIFLKDSYPADSWRSMLRKLCNILHTKHKDSFEATALDCKGKKGAAHFSRNPNDFRAHHEVNDSRIYVNIHGGEKQLKVRAYDVISHFEYAQDDLRFEFL